MKEHTDYQTIDYDGKPAFVLVPWQEFERVRPLLEGDKARATGIPQAVVEAHVLHDVPMIRAWREHIGITQGELAVRMARHSLKCNEWKGLERRKRGRIYFLSSHTETRLTGKIQAKTAIWCESVNPSAPPLNALKLPLSPCPV